MKNIYSLISKIPSLYDLASSIVGYTASVDYFVSKIPFSPDDTFSVLDAGCGTGPYSLALLRRFKNCQAVAFDLDEGLVAQLKIQAGADGRLKVFVGDISQELESLINQRFDLVVTAGVLEYVPMSEAVRNLSMYLKTDGYFLNSPVRNTYWGRIICMAYGCKPYSLDENKAVFLNNGFTLVRHLVLPKYRPSSFKEAHIFKKLA